MAGVTDAAFRQRLRRNGCRRLCTEMVSAAALARGNRRTLGYLAVPDPGPDLEVQLFGADPAELAEAGAMAVDAGFATVDLNAGCPVKKVVGGGAGAALLRDPGRLGRCLAALRPAVSGCLSVKIRAGWDAASINCAEVARIAEDAGVDRITLHPRTRSQGYAGLADWSLVEGLVRRCRVPVVGNGDIDSAAVAVDRLRSSGCSAVMVGRAALGSPWLFAQAAELWQGRPAGPAPEPRQIGEDLVTQLRDLVRWKGERIAVVEMRKFVAWGAKGFVGVAEFRRATQRVTEASELEERVLRFFDAAGRAGA
jgi:nifR3 family TIM-barrel protein